VAGVFLKEEGVARKKPALGLWYLVPVGLVAVVLVVGLVSLQPYGSPLNRFIRAAALLGYLTVFLTTLSSAYVKQLSRLLGRPFIKVHHILSVTGLVLVTLHPLGVAIAAASPAVLLPRFDSGVAFLRWGGPPAWTVIAAASLTAAVRGIIGRKWKTVHVLNYLAFWLATAHAILIGREFRQTSVRAVALVMALTTVAVLIRRRLPRRRR
jgi:sulfoxide reductase heme-binding subunit YedZ